MRRSEHEARFPAVQLSARLVLSVLGRGRKTPLPRTVVLSDERKLFELVKRGGFTLNISGRRRLDEVFRKKRGGVWLELTPEQYAKLRQPASNDVGES